MSTTSLENKKEIVLGSIFDSDLYKFTMQYAVLQQYPATEVEYRFTNRDTKMKFTEEAFKVLQQLVDKMGNMEVDEQELKQFKEKCPFFNTMYYEYLRSYHYKPDEVTMKMDDGNLDIKINGPWHSTILWEVPLMALISYCYFKYVDTDWSMKGQDKNIVSKHDDLSSAGVNWADFGSRRRRNYKTQEAVVEIMSNQSGKRFVGTSNVHFGLKHNTKVIGTMAHEWIMGTSALTSLRHANIYALDNWNKVYHGNLGIALTDTFGTDAFFKDFPVSMAKEYDGVRHDSGDPDEFALKVIEHYESFGIDTRSKTIVFSDGLDVQTAIDLNRTWSKKIKCSFGIGTHLTNDFAKLSSPTSALGESLVKSKPMNMVIKLYSVNDIPVVKLSDNPIKATGDAEALRVAKYTFFGESLNQQHTAKG